MASTNRTEHLGLCSWLETDKPKRTDFVSDNAIIDSVLGLHVANSDIHLDADEKARVGEPIKLSTLYGTGSDTSLRLNFSPKLVIAFKKNSPMYESSGNIIKINAAVATPGGSTGGVTVSGSLISFTQSASPSDGKLYNLSEQYAEYTVVSFR